MPEPAPLRVAVWAAVSTAEQATPDKTSLAEQERLGREFAGAIGGQVVRVYRVPGHSRDLVLWQEAEQAMPAYAQLREDAERRAFDVLHATDPDRLGRDPALSAQVISLIERSGAEIYLASAPHIVGHKSAGTRYVYAIQSVRAGEDQAIRKRRHQYGMRARVKRGLPATNWPLGYKPIRNARGHVISAELDENAGAVRLMTRLFLQGATYNQIRRALDASPYRPLQAEQWSASSINKMMLRDTYAGRPSWGAVQPNEPSELYPALWDEDTYRAILRERAHRAQRHKSRRSTMGPLSGIAFCARCGYYMTRYRTNKNAKIGLRCAKHSNKSNTDRPCHPNHIREYKVIAAIKQYLALANDPAVVQAELERITPAIDHRAELASLERAIAALQSKRKRLALTLAGGNMAIDVYRAADDELAGQLTAYENERSRAIELARAQPDIEARSKAMLALAAIADRLFELPALECNALLRETGIRVECESGRIAFIGPR